MPGHVQEARQAVGGDARCRRASSPRARPRAARPAARSYSSASLGPRATRSTSRRPTTSARSSTEASWPAHAHAHRPGGDLLGVEVAQQPDQAQAPARDLALEAVRRRAARRRGAPARACARPTRRRPWMDGPDPELLGPPQGEVDLLLVEQAHELVAQARRREVADEVHGAAGPRQVERVLVHAQPVAALVADGAQDPRGVLDEAQVVQHDDAAGVEVLRPPK